MKRLALNIVVIIIFSAMWWFGGREPYITMGHPSDPVLFYHEPTWNGWKSRGLRWVSDIPQAIKDDFPEAKGWWHVVHLTVSEKELPPIDIENPEKTIREWEKYYKWIPLHYSPSDNRMEGNKE